MILTLKDNIITTLTNIFWPLSFNSCKLNLQKKLCNYRYFLKLLLSNNFFKKLLKKAIALDIYSYLTLENYRYIYNYISNARAKGVLA